LRHDDPDGTDRLEAPGSPVVSDGEQSKPSFATYPVAGSADLAPDGAVIPFADGHQLPVLTAGPFRYQVHAEQYLRAAQRYARVPVKQAVIAPSALSLLNNQVLERFTEAERARIGVHTCPGGDQDSTHSLDVDYAGLLPRPLGLAAGNFYIQLASEPDPGRVLSIIAAQLPPGARIFIGVTDPIDPVVETPEQVRDRILLAARHIPAGQLGL
jgi:hypothetical protein